MNKLIASITSALTLVLVWTSFAAHAGVTYVADDSNEPIFRTCRQLAERAAVGFADIERNESITCLDSNYLTQVSFDRVLAGFQEDCAKMVMAKLGPKLNQEGDHDVQLSKAELTWLFVDNYYPVYSEFCSTKNPGKGITTRPAARPRGPVN